MFAKERAVRKRNGLCIQCRDASRHSFVFQSRANGVPALFARVLAYVFPEKIW